MLNINSFRGHINEHGVARNNRFIVVFSLPQEVTAWLAKDGTRMGAEGLSMRAESVQLPGYSYLPFESPGRVGYGPTEVMPYAPLYDDITITFLPDSGMHLHKILWAWHNFIINTRNIGQTKYNSTDTSIASVSPYRQYAYELTYKDKYTRDIDIHVYDELGNGMDSDNGRRMTIRLFKAWPRVLPQIDLSWASESEPIRMAVPFNYADFDIIYAAPRATPVNANNVNANNETQQPAIASSPIVGGIAKPLGVAQGRIPPP